MALNFRFIRSLLKHFFLIYKIISLSFHTLFHLSEWSECKFRNLLGASSSINLPIQRFCEVLCEKKGDFFFPSVTFQQCNQQRCMNTKGLTQLAAISQDALKLVMIINREFWKHKIMFSLFQLFFMRFFIGNCWNLIIHSILALKSYDGSADLLKRSINANH